MTRTGPEVFFAFLGLECIDEAYYQLLRAPFPKVICGEARTVVQTGLYIRIMITLDNLAPVNLLENGVDESQAHVDSSSWRVCFSELVVPLDIRGKASNIGCADDGHGNSRSEDN
jgi:hypothetical protein